MRPRPQEELSYRKTTDITEDPFPSLKPPVSPFLAAQPVLTEFLLALERNLAQGAISPCELERLAQKWVESLPRQRGAMIVPLSAALQPGLALGQAGTQTRSSGPAHRQKRKTTIR